MREKTNGFALRALVMFYKHCILNRVNIIFDMTLLEPEIDLYLMSLAKRMNYKIQTHILCVPRKISNLFIHLRQLKTGRIVKTTSSDYFFNVFNIKTIGKFNYARHAETAAVGQFFGRLCYGLTLEQYIVVLLN